MNGILCFSMLCIQEELQSLSFAPSGGGDMGTRAPSLSTLPMDNTEHPKPGYEIGYRDPPSGGLPNGLKSGTWFDSFSIMGCLRPILSIMSKEKSTEANKNKGEDNLNTIVIVD